MKNTEKITTPYYNVFQQEIKEWRGGEGGQLVNVYAHLFSLKDASELEDELEYLHKLSKGNDDFFKEAGKEDWFAIWHKSIRQCDYFENCYQRAEGEPLSKAEKAEMTFLHDRFKTKKENKYGDKSKGELFCSDYLRYLDLHTKATERKRDKSLSGMMDSILWNIISLDCDTNGVLYKLFKSVFNYVETEEEVKKIVASKKLNLVP